MYTQLLADCVLILDCNDASTFLRCTDHPGRAHDVPRAPTCAALRHGRRGDCVEGDDVPSGALQDVLAKHGLVDDPNVDFVELKLGEFLMPGFVDTHTVSLMVVCSMSVDEVRG